MIGVILALACLAQLGHRGHAIDQEDNKRAVRNGLPYGVHGIQSTRERLKSPQGIASLLLALAPLSRTRATSHNYHHQHHPPAMISSGNLNLANPRMGQQDSLNLHRRISFSRHRSPQMQMDRLGVKAIQGIMWAQDQAVRMNQNVTEEALLCGMFAVTDTSGMRELLAKAGGESKLRQVFQEMVGRGSEETQRTRIALTEGSKKALDKCVESGRVVEPDDIMRELVASPGSRCRQFLQRVGIDAEQFLSNLAAHGDDDRYAFTGAAGGTGQPDLDVKTLEQYTTDLSKKAEEGMLDPVIGRESEVEDAIDILARRKKNNPVLVGEPGVGKTAIAEGIAQRIADGQVPDFLKGKRIYELQLGELLAGTKMRGEFEERLTKIIDEVVASNRSIILMIDEIHTIVNAGVSSEGGMDAGNMMKPKLANGELQVIGATTRDEYRKYVEKDKALERRFSPIDVPEPSVERSIEILKGIIFKYEEYHGVTYSPEAVEACVKLSNQFIADRFLPDKAIEILDETGACVKIEHDEQFTSNTLEGGVKKVPEITEKDVALVVSEFTGIPVSKVSANESARLLDLESVLHSRVIGQDEAVVAVSKAVRRARSGLKDPNRPVASFIFAGPTGVGKTELCKALASNYYGDEKSMLRFDMSEFMESHTTSKLIGSPAGYIGYDDESQLCDRIRRNPYSLVVFDEIEKAHPDVFNIMLQILEDGRLTDSKGRVVSFKNAMIILTSNVGAQKIEKTIEGGGGFGFSSPSENQADSTYENLKKVLMDALKENFKPEFINRFDDTIVFRPLELEEIEEIAELEYKKVFERAAENYNCTVLLTQKFKAKVLEEGFDQKFGARPLRRAVSRLLADELATFTLSQPLEPGDALIVDVDDSNEVVVQRRVEVVKDQLEKELSR